MNLLKSVETTIANLVEGAFGRVFRSEVRPIELARKLEREMDSNRTASLSRVYAPNEYSIWLSPQDRARYAGVEQEVIDELCAHLLEHARREELNLATNPIIRFHTDEQLSLGEFGIQARLVRPADRPEPRVAPAAPAVEDERGKTMIYSGSERVGGAVAEAHARRTPRALLHIGDRRLPVPIGGAVVGRSRDCEIVLDDAGVSRRHAQLQPADGGWTIEDLGSTNGVIVNGREIHAAETLRSGDRIELGSTEIVFEVA